MEFNLYFLGYDILRYIYYLWREKKKKKNNAFIFVLGNKSLILKMFDNEKNGIRTMNEANMSNHVHKNMKSLFLNSLKREESKEKD